MATTEQVSDEFAPSLASFREMIREMRAVAADLAAKGTPEARMKARGIRCSATKHENWIPMFLDYTKLYEAVPA